MKTKGFIILTISLAILHIAFRNLVMDELDWRSVISAIVETLIYSSIILKFRFRIYADNNMFVLESHLCYRHTSLYTPR